MVCENKKDTPGTKTSLDYSYRTVVQGLSSESWVLATVAVFCQVTVTAL